MFNLILGVIIIIIFVLVFILGIDCLVYEEDSIVYKPFKKKHDYNSEMDSGITIRMSSYNALVCRHYSTYKYKKLSEFPFILFSQFYDFYCVSPDSWSLKEYRVYKDNDDELSFVFEYEEWKKYNKWYKQIQKEKEIAAINKKNQEIMEEKNRTARKILESVQKDIDAIRQESHKNISEASKLISEKCRSIGFKNF